MYFSQESQGGFNDTFAMSFCFLSAWDPHGSLGPLTIFLQCHSVFLYAWLPHGSLGCAFASPHSSAKDPRKFYITVNCLSLMYFLRMPKHFCSLLCRWLSHKKAENLSAVSRLRSFSVMYHSLLPQPAGFISSVWHVTTFCSSSTDPSQISTGVDKTSFNFKYMRIIYLSKFE